MSIRIYLLPTEIFFERMLARSWAVESILTIRSIFIILSSTGASPKAPPQTKQAFVLFTIFLISLIDKLTLVIVSMTSAVPAALVMALDEVFGIFNPAAAQIATVIGVVLFPATPPIECLSATFPFNFI